MVIRVRTAILCFIDGVNIYITGVFYKLGRVGISL